MSNSILENVPLERSIIETVEICLDLILEDIIVLAGHVLKAAHDIVDVGRGLLKVVHAIMHDVVSQEAQGQSTAGHKGEEAEAAADGSRLPLLWILCVTTSCAEVDEEDDQSGDEPGGWDGGQDSQALQVEIIFRVEPSGRRQDQKLQNRC